MESANPILPALRPSAPSLLRRTSGMIDAVRGIQQESKAYWFEKGVACKDTEQWEDAVFCFRKISTELQDWQTHLLQGYCDCRAHNFTESLISLRKFALEFIDKADFISQASDMFPYQQKMRPHQSASLLVHGLFETKTSVYDNGARKDDYHIRYEYISYVRPHIEQDRLLIALLLKMKGGSDENNLALRMLKECASESLKFEKARLLLWHQEFLIEYKCYDNDEYEDWIVPEWVEAVFYDEAPDLVEKYNSLLTLRPNNISVRKRIDSLISHINSFQLDSCNI